MEENKTILSESPAEEVEDKSAKQIAELEEEAKEILAPSEEELKAAQKETDEENKVAEENKEVREEVKSNKLNTARWEELEALLAEGNIKIYEAIGASKEDYEKIKENNERIYVRSALVIGGLLKHCTWLDILNTRHRMPRGTKVIMKTAKIQVLAKLLRENHNLTFARAISISEKRSKQLKTGQKLPTRHECRRITNYFLMSPKYFMDDNLDLPPVEKIRIDETIASIQRNDFENEVKLQKNKHYIQRNWQILSHGRRMSLIIRLGLTIVPLVAYTAACALTVIKDRKTTNEKYQINENTQVVTEKESYAETNPITGDDVLYNVGDSFEDAIYKSPKVKNNEDYRATVKIGTQLVKIGSISPSTSSYGVAMRLWMDFDQVEYHEMLQKRDNPNYKGALEERKQNILNYSKDNPQSTNYSDREADAMAKNSADIDVFKYDANTSTFEYCAYQYDLSNYNFVEGKFNDVDNEISYEALHCGDGIPDWMQIKNFSPYMIKQAEWKDPSLLLLPSDVWEKDLARYPLQTSSDNYPDNETMFIVGNGEIDAHSFSYEVAQQYTLTNNVTGETQYRYFQCCYFDATIRKAFDNVRYPLDSVQFHIYIMPMQLLVDNVEYVPTDVVSLNSAGHPGYKCSIEGQTFNTGVSPVFMMSSGYKLIKNYKNFVTRTYYYTDENYESMPDWSQFKTEYEIVVRANRQGFNLFLQAFMNLFCVAIWITIAFYSQSHQGENQLGMMGTGLFAGISSILVGLSMVSDAGIISMITMINVFTLAVIIIMTAQCIGARTAQVKADLVAQAYNGILMRIMFYILLTCTIVMFVGLPICGYMWFL